LVWIISDVLLRVQLTRAMLIDDIEQIIRRSPGLTASQALMAITSERQASAKCSRNSDE
jgi:hypothetical protein